MSDTSGSIGNFIKTIRAGLDQIPNDVPRISPWKKETTLYNRLLIRKYPDMSRFTRQVKFISPFRSLDTTPVSVS